MSAHGSLAGIAVEMQGAASMLTGFGRPFGLAVDSLGRLHVADMDLHAIARLERDQAAVAWHVGDEQGWSTPRRTACGALPAAVRRPPGRLNGPHSLAIRPDGASTIVTYYSPAIHYLDAKGMPRATMTEVAGQPLAGPATGRLDRREYLWIAEYGHHGIIVLDADGEFIGSLGGGAVDGFSRQVAHAAGHAAGAFDRPHMATELADGTIVVADTWNHRLQRFDAAGRWLGWLGDGVDCWHSRARPVGPGAGTASFHAPVAVGAGKDGRFVVTDWGNNRLQWFDIDGRWIAVEDRHALDRPYDAQPIGDALVVADSHNGRVLLIGAH